MENITIRNKKSAEEEGSLPGASVSGISAAGSSSASSTNAEYEKYPCIVCSLEKNSIQDLHDHQKCFHTTEELSLSIICLIHYMCNQNKALLSRLNYPFPSSSSYSSSSSNSYNNNELYNNKNNNSMLLKENDQLLRSSAYNYPQSAKNNLCSADHLKTNYYYNFNNNQFDVSNLQIIELISKVREISEDTFLKSVIGICKDLEMNNKNDDNDKNNKNKRKITHDKKKNDINDKKKKKKKSFIDLPKIFIETKEKIKNLNNKRSTTKKKAAL